MNKDELIKKVMASEDFTPDEKVEIIKGLTGAKEKEYVYLPYERQASPVPPSPWYQPNMPTYPIVTCSVDTQTVENPTYSKPKCYGGKCNHHNR